MDAGEIIRIDDVFRLALDNHLLVAVDSAGFRRRDEGRADIGHVCAHRLRREDGAAIGNGSAEQKRPVKPFADFLNECERRQRPGMAARAGGNGNQPVGALADRGIGMAVVDDIMQHDAAIGMDRLIDFRDRAQRRDDNRHLVFHAHAQIVFEPLVGHVDDLVDRKRRGRPVGIGRIVGREILGDLGQPFVHLAFRPRVQCRKRTNDARFALRLDQGRMRNDEQGRRNNGQTQIVLQNCRKSHGVSKFLRLRRRKTVFVFPVCGKRGANGCRDPSAGLLCPVQLCHG